MLKQNHTDWKYDELVKLWGDNLTLDDCDRRLMTIVYKNGVVIGHIWAVHWWDKRDDLHWDFLFGPDEFDQNTATHRLKETTKRWSSIHSSTYWNNYPA